MKITADLHCHTTASVHAYSTLRENIQAAKALGLQALGITDHGSGTADSPPLSYFENLISLPKQVDGIKLLRGVEANIMDFQGRLDLPKRILSQLDIVIASFHTSCTTPGTRAEHTNAYREAAANPLVHIIGHSGSAEFLYDYEDVIPLFKKNHKLVEINAHTFICRKKSIDNCKRIALLCKAFRVPVIVNSDAHSEFEVGRCDKALDMLKGLEFPEELIVNGSWERMERYLAHIKKGREV